MSTVSRSLLCALLLAAARTAAAQCPAGGPLTLAEGSPVLLPGNATTKFAEAYLARAATPNDPIAQIPTRALNANQFTPDATWLALVRAQVAGDPSGFRLVFHATAPTELRCPYELSFGAAVVTPNVAQPPSSGAPEVSITSYAGPESCENAKQDWRRMLGRTGRDAARDPFTMLIFLRGGRLCAANRDYGVQGDPIYVGVLDNAPAAWNAVTLTFDPCALQSASPSILVNGDINKVNLAQAQQYHLITFVPRRCYNESTTLKVQGSLEFAGSPSQTVNISFTLQQYTRYRGTLQVGTLNTALQEHAYGLRDSAGVKFVYDKGPVNRGPVYVATLVIYNLPRAIASALGGEHYEGREVLHEQGLLDRLGLVLGVGLPQPGRRFFAGLSGELLYGVNVLGGWEAALLPVPSGVEIGARSFSSSDEVPTRREWHTSRFIGGVAIDLAYAAKLLPK